jgi:dynein heavy chain 1
MTRTSGHADKLDHNMDFIRMHYLEGYVTGHLIIDVIWSFSSDARLDLCAQLGDFVREVTAVGLSSSLSGSPIIDHLVQINNGKRVALTTKVLIIEIGPHTVAEAAMVVFAVDTVCHEGVLYSWLSEHNPRHFSVLLEKE